MNTKSNILIFVCVVGATCAPPHARADFTFGKPVSLEQVIPALDPAHEAIECFSSDGLEIYIGSDRAGGQGDWDLWVLRRASTDDDWGLPENLGPAVNSPKEDSASSISADGLTLYFASNRVGASDYDIYTTTRATSNDPWGPPANLGTRVNSSATDFSPWISTDGLELHFVSWRPGGYGRGDIYVTRRTTTNDLWGEPVNLGPIVNSAYNEMFMSLSPDGLLLLFGETKDAPWRPGGLGGADMWMTRRASLFDPWQAPVNLGPQVNGPNRENIPRISPDGHTLYFCSNRGGNWNNYQAPILPNVDFDDDGDVDCTEVCILTEFWGTSDSLCDIAPPPFGDGVVDVQDLLLLAENLTATVDPNAPPDPNSVTTTTVNFTFGEPVNLKTLIPVIDPVHESIECFSSDGLEIYVGSDRAGGQGDWDICVLRRSSTDEDWGPPENLGPAVNSPNEDSLSCISVDGLILYFGSNRPGGYGSYDIYITTRITKNDPWQLAVNLGPKINSSVADAEPWLSPDGLELHFASYRSGGYGRADIYVARRATLGDPWSEPVNLGPVVNSAYEEHFLSLSPDGLLLLFSDRGAPYRPGGYGNNDMWMSKRVSLSDPWGPPINLGPQVNRMTHDHYPRISPDGHTLYFYTALTEDSSTWNNWQAPILPNVDFDDDGDVDCTEICIMTEFWGTGDSLCDIAPPPFGDGVVDVQDLIILAEHLFEGTPPTP